MCHTLRHTFNAKEHAKLQQQRRSVGLFARLPLVRVQSLLAYHHTVVDKPFCAETEPGCSKLVVKRDQHCSNGMQRAAQRALAHFWWRTCRMWWLLTCLSSTSTLLSSEVLPLHAGHIISMGSKAHEEISVMVGHCLLCPTCWAQL